MKRWILAFCFCSVFIPCGAFEGEVKLLFDAKKFGFSSGQVVSGGDLICLLGTSGLANKMIDRMILVDTIKGMVLWHQRTPKDFRIANDAKAFCQTRGNSTWLVSLEPDLNQAKPALEDEINLVWVYKFDQNGKLLVKRRVPLDGRITSLYGIELVNNALYLAGSIIVEDESGPLYSMYFTEINDELEFTTTILKSGSFEGHSSFRIIGKNVFLAGWFRKNEPIIDITDLGYAVAKLRLGGGYIWSTYLFEPNRYFPQAVFADDGSSVHWGRVADRNGLVTINSAGKVTNEALWVSPVWADGPLVIGPGKLILVQRECAPSTTNPVQKNCLLALDPKTGRETEVAHLPDSTYMIFMSNGKLLALGKNTTGNLILREIKLTIGIPVKKAF